MLNPGQGIASSLVRVTYDFVNSDRARHVTLTDPINGDVVPAGEYFEFETFGLTNRTRPTSYERVVPSRLPIGIRSVYFLLVSRERYSERHVNVSFDRCVDVDRLADLMENFPRMETVPGKRRRDYRRNGRQVLRIGSELKRVIFFPRQRIRSSGRVYHPDPHALAVVDAIYDEEIFLEDAPEGMMHTLDESSGVITTEDTKRNARIRGRLRRRAFN